MSIFSRRRAAPAPMPAPPPPAPVAQPAMPNPYLRNLPPAQPQQGRVGVPQPIGLQQRLMQQAQPSLSDAIALGKAGDQAGMQRMMQQIVGLPPSGAPQQPGMQQRQFPQPGQMGQMTDFQRAAMEMQKRQAQIASQMQPQPGMQQTVGPGLTPQGNLQPGFLGGIQPGQMAPLGGMPAGQQPTMNPMEMQQAAQQYAQQYAQMQMQQRQFPQPGQMGPQSPMINPQAIAAYPQNFGLDQQAIDANPQGFQQYMQQMQQREQMMPGSTMLGQQPGQMGPQPMQNAVFGGNLGANILGAKAMAQQPGMQPQQPNSLGQQFGQAQNPFARPLQPQQPNSPGQQQTGPFAGPAKLQQLGTAPQQPGMQQNSPMQKAGGSTGRTGLF